MQRFAGYSVERFNELMYAGILTYPQAQPKRERQQSPRLSRSEQYQKRKADGLCTKCVARREQADKSMCNRCLEKNLCLANGRNRQRKGKSEGW